MTTTIPLKAAKIMHWDMDSKEVEKVAKIMLEFKDANKVEEMMTMAMPAMMREMIVLLLLRMVATYQKVKKTARKAVACALE